MCLSPVSDVFILYTICEDIIFLSRAMSIHSISLYAGSQLSAYSFAHSFPKIHSGASSNYLVVTCFPPISAIICWRTSCYDVSRFQSDKLSDDSCRAYSPMSWIDPSMSWVDELPMCPNPFLVAGFKSCYCDTWSSSSQFPLPHRLFLDNISQKIP